jgi:hypothetical protein
MPGAVAGRENRMAFTQMTIAQFETLVKSFNWKRKINAVHMHHTWRPNHQQYRGQATIQAMWRHHTQVNRWSDIAQHISIAPDGTIWTGRAWNSPPASASGHNGNSAVGPFMFEIIGDFDSGKDPFQDPQRETVLRVIAAIQKKFGLPAESLKFHNQMSSKSCPGTGIDYQAFLNDVRTHHAAPRALAAADGAELDWTLIGAVSNERSATDPADAEPREGGVEEFFYDAESRGGDGLEMTRGRGPSIDLSPTVLDFLRPYVINLSQGKFSENGKFESDEGQVRAIFEQHLLHAVRTAELENKLPLRIVFYAHGGLVSETNALRMAFNHIQWWRANRDLNREPGGKNYSVYPIYFVWETGLLETLGQLLSRIRLRGQRGARDVFDITTDPVIEIAARALQGPTIWGGMKFSADLASRSDGGAHFAAERLAEFCSRPDVQGKVELHAIGHSAGSIFHGHFAPVVKQALAASPAAAAGLTGFEAAYFMAPAVRVDEFEAKLGGEIGAAKAIERLVMFTMTRNVERDDNCAQVYRKSLLYLIFHALERNPKTDLLGLEESIRRNPRLRALFGLGGGAGPGEIVWSPSGPDEGRSASRSRSHGGFDNDAPTMNSILRRVCGLDDNDPIFPFPEEHGRGLDDWEDQVDWPEELEFMRTPPGASDADLGVAPSRGVDGTRAVGTRRALCVGIDEYPTAPLGGCVADARLWSETLINLGFRETHTLFNGQATRAGVLERLRALLSASRSGDVVVFQFAGHGTQSRDLGGDETDGDTPGLDEAICPFDFAEGRLLIDDDLAEIFQAAPEGVCVTCFIDCCHSGTITRFAVGGPDGARSTERARFLTLTPEQVAAHLRFRRSLGRSRAVAKRGPEEMREVVFSACNSKEVALESDGHGHFTVRATRVLQSGADGVSNREFQRRVTEAFGPAPRQHPELDCSPNSEELLLLCPAAGRPSNAAPTQTPATGSPSDASGSSKDGSREALARALHAAADALLKS